MLQFCAAPLYAVVTSLRTVLFIFITILVVISCQNIENSTEFALKICDNIFHYKILCLVFQGEMIHIPKSLL